jgi:hypothetical protein
MEEIAVSTNEMNRLLKEIKDLKNQVSRLMKEVQQIEVVVELERNQNYVLQSVLKYLARHLPDMPDVPIPHDVPPPKPQSEE